MPILARLTDGPLDIQEFLAFVDRPGHGARTIFAGVVRDHNEGRRVSAVTYEAFKSLAEKTISRIAEDAGRRWNALCAVGHRIGTLKVGETSLIVAVSSAHRAEAFAACRFAVGEIKRQLPIWKKEHYLDGTGSWLPGCSLIADDTRETDRFDILGRLKERKYSYAYSHRHQDQNGL